MATLGSLVVKIAADLTQFSKGIKEGVDQSKAFSSEVEKIGDRIGKALTFGAAILGVKELTTKLFDVTAAAAAHAEQMQLLSQQTGIATTTFEQWSVPLARVNLTQQDLAIGMKKLSKELLEGSDSVRALGITTTNSDEALRQIADQFAAMPDGIQKTALAQELFGKSGLNLIPILNMGSAGLAEAAEKSRAFGLVLTDTQRNALAAFDDKLDDAGKALEGFKTQIAIQAVPALRVLAEWFTNSVVAGTELIQTIAGIRFTPEQLAQFEQLRLMQGPSPKSLLTVPPVSPDIAAALAERKKFITEQERQVEIGTREIRNVQEMLFLRKQEAQFLPALMAMRSDLQKGIDRDAKLQLEQQQQLREAEDHHQVVFIQNSQAREARAIEEFTAREEASLALFQTEVEAELKADAAHERFLGERILSEDLASRQVGGFWARQAHDLVASNTFAISQITNSFSSGVAQWAVLGQGFKNFWQNLQLTLVQTAVQGLIQLAAREATFFAFRQGLITADTASWILGEKIKTSTSLAADAVRTASTTTSAAVSTAAVTGSVAAQTGVMAAFAASSIKMLLAVWAMAKAVLTSMAAALKASVWGIPIGLAIMAALIAGAIMVASASKLAAGLLGAAAVGVAGLTLLQHGGIVRGPTLAMLGEAGPEAVVPLRHGGWMGGEQTIVVVLDSREIARATSRHYPRVWRIMGSTA